MRKRKILLATLVLVIGFNNGLAYASNNKINSYKDKLSSTNSSIKNTQNKINQIKEQHNYASSKVSQIENEINTIQAEIDIQNTKLNKLEIEYKNKQDELEQLKLEYEKNYKLFEKQLISSYTSSYKDNYFKVIFSASDLSDFIIGNTFFKYLLKDKDVQLESLDANMEKQTILLAEIESNKIEVEKIKKDLDEKRSSLESKQESYQNEINSLIKDANELEAILEAESKEAQKLEYQIKELQEELYNSNSNTSNSLSNNSNNTSSNSNDSTNNSKGFGWPTNSRRVTSKYGYRIHPVSKVKKMHTGIDIGEGMGANIYASNSGTVIYADWRGGYGKTIIIDHGNYMTTLYAHLNTINVSKGQKVAKGQKIGTMGSTGVSTGPHLHFEVRKNGAHQNPLNYIK